MKPQLVAVCVATYRRPAGLRALLDSLEALRVPAGAAVHVVVVDNDAAADPAAPPPCRLPLSYVVEPVRGVVAARNRGLAEAPADAAFVAFVDDDERVSPGWLEAMLATLAATGAAAAQGPVEPAFAVDPPAWMRRAGVFELGPFEDGAPMGFAATNNSMVDKAWIDRLGLRFDMRFNLTGGEDQHFFDRLQAAGGRIVAAADALVRDDVPAARIRLGWVLRRQFRAGVTLGRIALIMGRGRGLRALKGAGKLALGAAGALGAPLIGRHPGPSLGEAARGLGMLAAYAGLGYEEYGDKAVAAERAAVGG